MSKEDFLKNHYEQCAASDADPQLLGRIEAALDTIYGAGIEKLAFDLEGVLVAAPGQHMTHRLRRRCANAVLRLANEHRPSKMKRPIVWTAAAGDCVDRYISQAGLVVPAGVEVYTAIEYYLDTQMTPKTLFSQSDLDAYEEPFRDPFKRREEPLQEYVKKCCATLVQNYGLERLRQYCGVATTAEIEDALSGKTTLLRDHHLSDLIGGNALQRWQQEVAARLYETRVKVPHTIDVGLLFDDSQLHRFASILLGHFESARKVCAVPEFSASRRWKYSKYTSYHCGDRDYQTSEDYFAGDDGLVAALESAASSHVTPGSLANQVSCRLA